MDIERILVLERYSLVCILMLLIIIGYHISYKKQQQSKSNFLWLGLFNLLLCVAGAVVTIAANSDVLTPIAEEYLNKCYVACIVFYCVMYLDYFVAAYVGRRQRYAILCGAGIFALLLCCYLFYLPLKSIQGENIGYGWGNAVMTCYAFGFLMFAFGDLVVLVNRRKQRLTMTLGIIGYSLFAVLFMALQIIYPGFLFEDCLITILTLGLFVSVENPVLRAQHQSFVDLCTGVSNKNGYEQYLKEAIKQVKVEEPGQIACVVCDLNNLKYVNDNYGHQEGDRMIAKAAEIISRHASSRVYRTGGDEFVVFERKPDAERLTAYVGEIQEQCRLNHDSFDGAFSIAVGYAIKEAGESLNELIRRADQCMYEEKAHMKASQDARFDMRKRRQTGDGKPSV